MRTLFLAGAAALAISGAAFAQTVPQAVVASSCGGETFTVGDQRGQRMNTAGRLCNEVAVASSALPAGAATSAKQDTIIGHVDGVEGSVDGIEALLTTLDGRVDGIEALQTSGNASLSAINTKLKTAGVSTYRAFGEAYAGYATPTDMLCVIGSGTKTVRVTKATMWIDSTSSTPHVIKWILRSAANTGGTASNPSFYKIDSANAAATATLNLYSVIPDALGSAIGTYGYLRTATTAVGTGTHAAFTLESGNSVGILPLQAVDIRQLPTLRGTSEQFCINGDGAALPAGFVAKWMIEIVEE